MADRHFILVHANVALMREALDHPLMRSFVEQMEEINNLARFSKGFISQLEPADSGAIYHGKLLLNTSSWRSVADLRSFALGGRHGQALENRARWFERQNKPNYVLFWLAANEAVTERTIAERINHLYLYGPTAFAFDFKQTFTAAGVAEPVG